METTPLRPGTATEARQSGSDPRFGAIRAIAGLLNKSTGLEAILGHIVKGICAGPLWESSSVMAVDREHGISERLAWHDTAPPQHDKLPSKWKLSISASLRAVNENRPIIINTSNAAEFPEWHRDAKITGLQSCVMLPLNATDDRGRDMTLSVSSRAPVEVGDDDVSFLVTVAHLAAIAIQKDREMHYERVMSNSLKRAFEIGMSIVEQEPLPGTLDALITRIQTVMKYPFALVDHRTGECLTTTSPIPRVIDNFEWPVFAETELREFFSHLAATSTATGFRDVRELHFPTHPPITLGAIIEPVFLNEEHVCTLFVFPDGASMEDPERVICQTARLAIALHFYMDTVVSRDQSDLNIAYIEALVDGKFESERDAQRKGARLNIDPGQPAQLLLFDVDINDLPANAVLSLNKTPFFRQSGVLVVSKPDHLLAYVPIRGKRSLAIAEKQILRIISPGTSPQFAYTESENCGSMFDLALRFSQCKRVITIARSSGAQGRVSADDFGALPLLLDFAGNTATEEFLAKVIMPIEEYDRERGSDLLDTVRVFVGNNLRFQSTARDLGVHISTVRYRISRLKEIFGIDLENPEEAFNFALAFRLRDAKNLFRR